MPLSNVLDKYLERALQVNSPSLGHALEQYSRYVSGESFPSKQSQPANLQKKQCGGVYFCQTGVAH